jgi:hypothetical protein
VLTPDGRAVVDKDCADVRRYGAVDEAATLFRTAVEGRERGFADLLMVVR